MKNRIVEYAAVAVVTAIIIFAVNTLRGQSDAPKQPVQFQVSNGYTYIYDPNTKIMRTWLLNGKQGRKYRIEADKDFEELFDK
jgi:hypothetical protein